MSCQFSSLWENSQYKHSPKSNIPKEGEVNLIHSFQKSLSIVVWVYSFGSKMRKKNKVIEKCDWGVCALHLIEVRKCRLPDIKIGGILMVLPPYDHFLKVGSSLLTSIIIHCPIKLIYWLYQSQCISQSFNSEPCFNGKQNINTWGFGDISDSNNTPCVFKSV